MYYNFKNILLKNGLEFQRKGQNIYNSLYNALKTAILNSDLSSQFKLPPSRILAKDLNISRSTVIKAYDLLLFENYIYSKQGSGYFIKNISSKSVEIVVKELNSTAVPHFSKLGKSFKNYSHFNIDEDYTGSIAFRPGLPPLDIFPTNIWQNLVSSYWKTVKYSDLSYSNTLGLDSLRKNIASYLKIYRNVYCNANQIVITTGSLHSISIINMALLNPKDGVILENPSYKKAYNLFKSLKAKIITANLSDDDYSLEKIDVEKLKLLYATPSNQYPTGKKMSVKRRLEILDFANKNDTFIIEDDYDHEFSNWKNPSPSIFSLDQKASVIYLGTFNKLLHPSLRLGYMIIPESIVTHVSAICKQTYRFVPPSLQNVMSQFIEKDYLNKHLRKVLNISQKRKEVFIKNFEELFGNDILLDQNQNGLHLIGYLKKGINDFELSDYLLKNGIITFPLSSYYIEGESKNGLVMGYCSVNKNQIKKRLNIMYNLYTEFAYNKL
jgi:GntR family transcriptional regulator / MocR family aminotransferase